MARCVLCSCASHLCACSALPFVQCGALWTELGRACRKFAVFGERALAAEAQQRSAAEGVAADGEDDSVYELTSTDVHRELAAIQRRNAYNDAGLRTQARYAPGSAACRMPV